MYQQGLSSWLAVGLGKAPGAARLISKALVWGCRLQSSQPHSGRTDLHPSALCCGTPRPRADTEHSGTWTPGRKWPPGEKSPMGSSAQLCRESRPDVGMSTGEVGAALPQEMLPQVARAGPQRCEAPGAGQAYSAAPPQQLPGTATLGSCPPRPRAPGCRVLPASPSCPARVLRLPHHPDSYQLPGRDQPPPSPAQNSASHKPLRLRAARLPGRAGSSAPPAGRRPFPTGNGGTCRRPGTEMAEPAFAWERRMQRCS